MSDLTDADRAYTAHHIDALRMDVASAQHRATTAEKQRDLALDGHRLDDEMIDQLRAERDRYREALRAAKVNMEYHAHNTFRNRLKENLAAIDKVLEEK